MILRVVSIILFISFIYTAPYKRSCSNYSSEYRGRPNLDTSILSPSGHFQIHYDKIGADAATDSYANEAAIAADQIRDIIVNDMGFLPEINDSDGIYDIYIQDLEEGDYGSFLSDIPDDPDDYIHSSYILIDNEYENDGGYYTTGLNTMKLTLAHEFFHAVQAAYREKNGNIDVYFYEMMGMWMEDIIVPDGNDYIYWVDDGDAMDHFFMDPEMSMTASDGYSITLFAHYLNNIYSSGDGIIIRQIWEELDLIGDEWCMNPTSNLTNCCIQSIKNVLLNSYNVSFEEAWNDYTSRLFFNGSNDYGNNLFFHEDQIDVISLSTYLPDPESINVGETSFSIDLLNNSSSRYKLYQTNSLGILSFDYEDVASSEFVDHISVISEFGPILNQHADDLSSIYIGGGDTFVLTYSASNDLDLDVTINYSNNINIVSGDCNLDDLINIQDIILIIDFLLYNVNFNQLQFENSDINDDNSINIFDVILLIELILN